MKRMFFVVVMSVAANMAMAQIPNSSFETWTSAMGYNEPDGWGTLNAMTTPASIYTCTKGTPGNTGSAYIKLVSQNVPGMGVMPGMAVSGTLDMTTMAPSAGFVYTSRPAALTGSWQYMAFGSDMGSASVYLTKWNTITNQRDTVGTATQSLQGMVMSWTPFSIPISYATTAAPDSALIILSASGIFAAANSYLYVDDLAFTGSATGVANVAAATDAIVVYPNPASNNITVGVKGSTAFNTITMTDVKGAVVKTINNIQGQSQYTISTADMARGIYFIQLNGAAATTSKKVVVQ